MRFARVVSVTAIVTALGLSVSQIPVRAQDGPEELDQLVAPIALYPDELVAEVLAASTYPSDVDAAAQWVQEYAAYSPDQIADAVNDVDWDDSVKALTEFPSVLSMMDQNLSWTSALGDAYANQPDDVMAAIQDLRRRAMAAGTLASSSEIRVTVNDGIISIEPVTSDTIYVPEYDGWSVYGAPISPWPEFVFGAGIVAGAHIGWGGAIRIGGAWGHVAWGWHSWNSDWSNHRVNFDRKTYVTHSPSIIDHHFPQRAQPAPAPAGRAAPRAPVAAPRGSAPVSPIGAPRVAVNHQNDRGFTPAPAPARAPAPAGRPAPTAQPVPAVRPAPTARPEPTSRPEPAARAASPQPPAGRPATPPAGRAEAPKAPAPTRPAPPVPVKAAPPPPKPAPPPPSSGTKAGAFTAVNHGNTAAANADRGRQSMGAPRANPAPRPAAPPKPAPAPAPKGRGRGGL